MWLRCIQIIQVIKPHNCKLTLAIKHTYELEADFTAIPVREFVRKRSPDGMFYYTLLYCIGITFRNIIEFRNDI
jgi:hypothetical protein